MRLAPLTQFNGGMLMRFHVWILTLIMLFGSAGICVSEFSEANNTGGTDSGCSSVYTEYGAWKYTGQTWACRHGDPSRRDQEKKRKNTVYWQCGSISFRVHPTETEWECMY